MKTQKDVAHYKARAEIVKALAHPARLLIVDQLARSGPQCVCDLTSMIGSDMSTVSRHLHVLKAAGLVTDEKRGQMVYYHCTAGCLRGFFDALESIMEANAERQTSLL